jgi:hypothetical protein
MKTKKESGRDLVEKSGSSCEKILLNGIVQEDTFQTTEKVTPFLSFLSLLEVYCGNLIMVKPSKD